MSRITLNFLLTSKMFGINSSSHILRNCSLENDGSALRISVNTSDISVEEKILPAIEK